MKRLCKRNESPRPLAAKADPAALPRPQSPDSRRFRLLLNSNDLFLRRVAELARRVWFKQRPQQDADAILAQVLEDIAEERYAVRHLAAYVNKVPLVAAPHGRLAEMIADFMVLRQLPGAAPE